MGEELGKNLRGALRVFASHHASSRVVDRATCHGGHEVSRVWRSSPGGDFAAQPCYVAIIIMGVAHYCISGLEIEGDSAVLSAASQPDRGLCTGGRDDGC